MTDTNYDVIHEKGKVPIKSWTRGVPFEDVARKQLLNVASLPFIHRWVAAMPDVHWGIGATVGSVIPTVGAVESNPNSGLVCWEENGNLDALMEREGEREAVVGEEKPF
jgi:hypothetical protein